VGKFVDGDSTIICGLAAPAIWAGVSPKPKPVASTPLINMIGGVMVAGGRVRTTGFRVMSRALRVLGFGLRAGLSAKPDDLWLLLA
jgi:hypothetical protein